MEDITELIDKLKGKVDSIDIQNEYRRWNQPHNLYEDVKEAQILIDKLIKTMETN